jgi:hypothetical protein
MRPNTSNPVNKAPSLARKLGWSLNGKNLVPNSFQLCVLCLGLLQDGDVRVGVFPEREEILIRDNQTLFAPMWLRCKTEAAQERLEPGARANGVEPRIHFEENEPVVALMISLFEPLERLIVCAQTHIKFTDYVG